jgi:hypothetical protein
MHLAWVFVTSWSPAKAGQMKKMSYRGFSVLRVHVMISLRKDAVASVHRTGSFCREACFPSSLRTTHTLPLIFITTRKA